MTSSHQRNKGGRGIAGSLVEAAGRLVIRTADVADSRVLLTPLPVIKVLIPLATFLTTDNFIQYEK